MMLDKAKEMVRETLKRYPEARRSDKFLIIKILQNYYPFLELKLNFAELNKVPSFETFRRARQLLQNEGCEYLPPKKVMDARAMKEAKWAAKLKQESLNISSNI